MRRYIPFIFFMTAMTIAQSGLAQVQLRSQTTVSGDVITLGDLFAGVGDIAHREIGPAPAPGRTAIYKADHLIAIARAHRLSWRPLSSVSRAIVTRGGQTTSPDEIVALLHREFRRQGATGRIKIHLNRLRNPIAHSDENGGLRIDELTYDDDGGAFSAYLHSNHQDGRIQRHMLRGRVDFVARVPVPRRSIRKGQEITHGDIKWAELSQRLLGPETVETMDDLIGKAARRNLRQNQPIKPGDLREPIMISKGSTVTVSLQSGGLRLSSTGRALEDGSEGEIIRVMNTQSKRTLEASVVAPDHVRVALSRQIAVAAKR